MLHVIKTWSLRDCGVSHPPFNFALFGDAGSLPVVCPLASWEWLEKTSLTCGSGSQANFQTSVSRDSLPSAIRREGRALGQAFKIWQGTSL